MTSEGLVVTRQAYIIMMLDRYEKANGKSPMALKKAISRGFGLDFDNLENTGLILVRRGWVEKNAKTWWEIDDSFELNDEGCAKIEGCEDRQGCWICNPKCPRNKKEWVRVFDLLGKEEKS